MPPKTKEKVVIPRNFILLDELEKSEKGKYAWDATISADAVFENILLKNWSGTIITDPRRTGGQEYTFHFSLYAGDDYPKVPPVVKLVDNPPYIPKYKDKNIFDEDGTLNKNYPLFKKGVWTYNNRLVDIMVDLKLIIEGRNSRYG